MSEAAATGKATSGEASTTQEEAKLVEKWVLVALNVYPKVIGAVKQRIAEMAAGDTNPPSETMALISRMLLEEFTKFESTFNTELQMDTVAFMAFTQQKKIALGAYFQTHQEHQAQIASYVNPFSL
eukprot:TRINITY_DN7758_c0_g1_i1.p1 TRINITY_DN7758_c0_g1~~TRINITY_DN7758_c0_g1_i1.p1  ORF type:complete len:126 (+),score=46.27 TRINITY_DN7758_c0_g1_i1:91-468(+)